MRYSPFQLIIETLDTSINALKPVVKAMNAAVNTARHQLLLPDSEQGLQEALFAYEVYLTEGTLSGHNRTIKQLLADYNNEWSALFDAVRDNDKTLAPLVKIARDAQKAVHTRLKEILYTGNGVGHTEYSTLSAALTTLSEAMGENANAAAKKRRKGIPHQRTRISVPRASELTGIPAITIRRAWNNHNHPNRPPLNSSAKMVIAWGKTWKEDKGKEKAGKHEANMKNHAIPLSSVGSKTKRRTGMT